MKLDRNCPSKMETNMIVSSIPTFQSAYIIDFISQYIHHFSPPLCFCFSRFVFCFRCVDFCLSLPFPRYNTVPNFCSATNHPNLRFWSWGDDARRRPKAPEAEGPWQERIVPEIHPFFRGPRGVFRCSCPIGCADESWVVTGGCLTWRIDWEVKLSMPKTLRKENEEWKRTNTSYWKDRSSMEQDTFANTGSLNYPPFWAGSVNEFTVQAERHSKSRRRLNSHANIISYGE